MPTLLIKDATLVHPSVTETVDVLVCNGEIASVASHDSPTYALPVPPDGHVDEVIEAAGLLLFPGLIDAHVHFREPGFPAKATMRTEAKAAVAGGVLTVCDMPNTDPPTVTVAALRAKVERASRIETCDIRFFFGATEKVHLEELKTLFTDPSLTSLRSRCCGLKLYLDHSTGNQKAAREILSDAFALCAELGIVAVCHCEDAETNAERLAANRRTDVSAHAEIRPPESEERAITEAVELARRHAARLHVAHLSTEGGLRRVREAKEAGLAVTCEVAPHHLFLTTEDFGTLGTLAKMNPPLRSAPHRDALWKGIEDGTVDCIASDHAPHTLAEKQTGEPLRAPSGVPGVETMLPLLLTVAAGKWAAPVKLVYEDIRRLCFDNPNRIFSLGKEDIAEGSPASFVLADPKSRRTIRGAKLHSKCKWTPYEGWKVMGRVAKVFVGA